MKFSDLKKQSSSGAALERLRQEVDKMNNGSFNKDELEDRFWKPTPDKSGNALAVIRFLPGPAVDGEAALPSVRWFDHGFKNKTTGKWYIEKSLTTFNEKDPVSEYNSRLWNSNQDDNSPERKQAREQKRRLHYASVIEVVSDPKNPENEGKVFYFKYGKKIMDKIVKMMNPDLETEPKIDPFDLWKGANFKLKVTRQNVNINGQNVSFPNYDESVFLPPSPARDNDDDLKALWESEPSLLELIDRKHFKTYEELERRLNETLGITTAAEAATPSKATARNRPAIEDDESVPFTGSKPIKRTTTTVDLDDMDEDDELAIFKRLAED